MLTSRYADDTSVFLHVDLTRYPELAKELKINIDGYAGEIPVFISFRKVDTSIIIYHRGKRSVVSPSSVRNREGVINGQK